MVAKLVAGVAIAGLTQILQLHTIRTDGDGGDDRYVTDDKAGATTLDNAILDLRRGVEGLANGRPAVAPASFKVTGSAIPCGSDDPDLGDLFPYPMTEIGRRRLARIRSG